MLTDLKNGVHVRLADVRSIKVEKLAKAHGWESEWGVKIKYGDSFDAETETCVFDSDHAAHKYADEIAGLASAAMKEEANRTIEKDTRRNRDRYLDRVAVIVSGALANPDPRILGGFIQSGRLKDVERIADLIEGLGSPT